MEIRLGRMGPTHWEQDVVVSSDSEGMLTVACLQVGSEKVDLTAVELDDVIRALTVIRDRRQSQDS